MKRVKPFILVVLLFLGASVSLSVRGQSSPVKRMSPDALVKDLYTQHDRKHSPFFQTRSRALLYKYFEKSIADKIWKDAVTSKGEVGVIDGDPLYDAQDMEIRNFVINKPTYADGKARVNVTFENFGQKKSLVFVLANGRSGWRIRDIEYGESGTLAGWFKDRR